MNATETRNHLRNVAGSLLDHMGDRLNDWTEQQNANGPRRWQGVGDLETLVGELSRMVARFDGAMTPEEVREAAEECVAECKLS